MGLEVGEIYEGKVTGITKFGAFVSFEGGQTGMVHISEIAPTFVSEIKDFVSEGQTVRVKVLSVSEEGKISLSIKKALPPEEQHKPRRPGPPQGGRRPAGPRPPELQDLNPSQVRAGRETLSGRAAGTIVGALRT